MKTLKKACLLLALALIPLGNSGKAWFGFSMYLNEKGATKASYIAGVWGVIEATAYGAAVGGGIPGAVVVGIVGI